MTYFNPDDATLASLPDQRTGQPQNQPSHHLSSKDMQIWTGDRGVEVTCSRIRPSLVSGRHARRDNHSARRVACVKISRNGDADL